MSVHRGFNVRAGMLQTGGWQQNQEDFQTNVDNYKRRKLTTRVSNLFEKYAKEGLFNTKEGVMKFSNELLGINHVAGLEFLKAMGDIQNTTASIAKTLTQTETQDLTNQSQRTILKTEKAIRRYTDSAQFSDFSKSFGDNIFRLGEGEIGEEVGNWGKDIAKFAKDFRIGMFDSNEISEKEEEPKSKRRYGRSYIARKAAEYVKSQNITSKDLQTEVYKDIMGSYDEAVKREALRQYFESNPDALTENIALRQDVEESTDSSTLPALPDKIPTATDTDDYKTRVNNAQNGKPVNPLAPLVPIERLTEEDIYTLTDQERETAIDSSTPGKGTIPLKGEILLPDAEEIADWTQRFLAEGKRAVLKRVNMPVNELLDTVKKISDEFTAKTNARKGVSERQKRETLWAKRHMGPKDIPSHQGQRMLHQKQGEDIAFRYELPPLNRDVARLKAKEEIDALNAKANQDSYEANRILIEERKRNLSGKEMVPPVGDTSRGPTSMLTKMPALYDYDAKNAGSFREPLYKGNIPSPTQARISQATEKRVIEYIENKLERGLQITPEYLSILFRIPVENAKILIDKVSNEEPSGMLIAQ